MQSSEQGVQSALRSHSKSLDPGKEKFLVSKHGEFLARERGLGDKQVPALRVTWFSPGKKLGTAGSRSVLLQARSGFQQGSP